MVSGGMLRTTDASAATPEAVFDLIAAATPLGRVTTPDDMADAALFFASPWSRAVTGLNLIVDGGWSLADAACPGSYEALCVVRSQLLWQRGQLDLSRSQGNCIHMVKLILDPPTISEIIEMALSDHVSFDQIRTLHGLGPDEVKALMRQNLKSGSYRAWRRRVRQFSDRREVYK